MKNFLRALRHAWPYRFRLILSIFCALMAAVFWGLNFTSVYPVLKLLHTEQTPHQWIEERIKNTNNDIDELKGHADRLHKRVDEMEAKPRNKWVEQVLRDLSSDLAKVEGKLEAAHIALFRFQVAKKWFDSLLPPDVFQCLVLIFAVVFVGVILKCFFEFAQEWLVGSVVALSLYDFRNRFYHNVIHLDVDQFSDQGTGELMARFTNDMDSLGTGIRTLFGKVVAEPLRALACIIFALFISWQLTLMFLILVPVAGFILAKVGRMMKQATRRVLERMSSIYKILQESFQGIRVVKACTSEGYERERFEQATHDYYKKTMRVVKIDALAGPIIEILGVAAIAAALLAGSYLVLYKQTHVWGFRLVSQPLEAEALFQLYLLLAAIADPVRKLSNVFTRIQSGWAAADRIFAFLDRRPRVTSPADGHRPLTRAQILDPTIPAPPELDEPPFQAEPETVAPRRAIEPRDATAFLEFRNVCFSYVLGQPILEQVNLRIEDGETIAVVGANGCGKTTLLSLLPRFYDPDHGSILLEGHDLRNCHLGSLRRIMGVVTQDPILFDTTIAANIAYGVPDATREQIEEAGRLALVDEFLQEFRELFPEGYDTVVRERGARLSGGQRQRVALARAILRDPRILILDEFTSQADPESNLRTHQALRGFMKGRTTLVITHNLNTLEIANRIIVMDDGKIAAVGTHAELLATCVQYQRLHDAHSTRLSA
jgi:ATP-binding cassette subfamily B protein/subfamily B ATP-binding cassette protein MsbA